MALEITDANFTEIKSILQTLLKIGFRIEIQTKTVTNPSFKDGHCANIIFNGEVILWGFLYMR